ncbi:complement C1s subcomponent isoform X2 [Rana temporaria]|uniref:complement C1s subcomponent isoform X2 n=1 Tax=Rana temporaria TaxID=8407 RepID=UPI001AAD788E|nr:complement C1s subcomponent isoform X2 [Rana temporaria]
MRGRRSQLHEDRSKFPCRIFPSLSNLAMATRWLLLAVLGCVGAESPPMFGEITSPNYPQGYPDNAKESWDVRVPEGYGIRLYFIHLDIEPSDGCEYDALKVVIGDAVEDAICGRNVGGAPGHPIKERYYPSNTLQLLFTSDFSNQERYTGFSAYYVAVDVDECEDGAINPCSHFCNNYIGGYFCSCPPEYDLHEDQHTCGVNCSGGRYTELRGQISSPGYPSPYPENSLCEYKVLLEPGYQVILTFQPTDFDIEEADDGSCSYDSLMIKAKGRKFGPFCGKSPPPPIETGSYEVDVLFQTDSGGDNKGWKLRYSEDAIPCPNQVTENSILDPQNAKYIFKDMVTVRCEEGFEIVAGDKKTLSFLAKCQADGTWSNAHLQCQPVDCGNPKEADFAEMKFESTTYQSEAKYNCKSDYYSLLGEETYHCSLDGVWVNSKGQTDPPTCKPVCGRTTLQHQSRIYGGSPAENGYFPWVIHFPSGDIGGGSLISDQWVLTAAHVVQDHNLPRILAGDVMHRKGVELVAKKVIIHPSWIRGNNEARRNYDNDIALVQLSQRIEMGPCICPVCLPENMTASSPDIDEVGYVAGWGKPNDDFRRLKTATLQYAPVSVRKTEDCKNSVVTDQVFTENMICAGGGGKDSCQGDSGGPLMFRYVSEEVEDERLYLGGIVSWGLECGKFGMYSRVRNYLEWIKETIKETEREDAGEQKTKPLKICK